MWTGGSRDVDAAVRLDLFIVSGVTTVLVTRAYLAATGYPQVGGGGLHIAHAVWGGLLLALALMLGISSLTRRYRTVAALVGGIGFGLFIDELGKFITSDVNYFFEPAAALIYLSFIAIYAMARLLVDRPALRSHEELENAMDIAREAATRPLRVGERNRIEELLSRCDPADSLTGALRRALPAFPVRPDPRPGRTRIAWEKARSGFVDLVTQPVFRVVVAVAAVLFVLGVLLQVIGLIVAPGDLATADGSSDEDGFVAWAATIGSLAQGVLTAIGLVYLRRSRIAAYRWFERALLLNLLVTQVFLFAQHQFAAAAGFFVSLIALVVLRTLINAEPGSPRGTPADAIRAEAASA